MNATIAPRHFTVMEPMATDRGAHLRFRGNWLVEAGFAPGDRFQLTNPEPGVLQLRRIAPASDTDFAVAIDRLNRLQL
jgi:hypothetical protein